MIIAFKLLLNRIFLSSNKQLVVSMSGNQTIHRREYERQLEELKMPMHYYGYTNRILFQENSSADVNYFIPVYLIMKIKSIQDIDIQKLTGTISCVILVNILIEDLPAPLVHMLESNIEMQINRSELLILKEDRENNINMSKNKKMLKFTIRRNLSATIVSDTLWSPFQIIRLVISITFNSISQRKGMTILKHYQEETKKTEDEMKEEIVRNVIKGSVKDDIKNKIDSSKDEPAIDFNEFRKYTISFNCMRNGAEVPISYSLGCVYSLYDLAEKKLDVYHTNIDSYTEVMRTFEERGKEKPKDSGSDLQTKPKEYKEQPLPIADGQQIQISEEENLAKLESLTQEIMNFMNVKFEKKDSKVKAKYFQYSHFVIPLYKYPGNSLATIFIPLFLLALLSLAIFFQPNELSNRISSIATMVLGYIALIPSIKEQLPPSSRITVLQIVIYISTLCCLFSLVESIRIDDDTSYVFCWRTNPLFLVCLIIHIGVFLFIGALLLLHRFVWEPSYNIDTQARKTDPEKDPHEWINPYCDQQFYKANSKIYKNNQSAKGEKDKSKLICKYEPELAKVLDDNLQIKKEVSISHAQLKEETKETSFIDALKIVIEERKKEKEKKTKSEEEELKEEQNKQEKKEEIFKKKIEQLSKEKKEEISKEKKEDKKEEKKKVPKKVFRYQLNLKFLDELIKKGGHILWKPKPKPVPKPKATEIKEGYEPLKQGEPVKRQ